MTTFWAVLLSLLAAFFGDQQHLGKRAPLPIQIGGQYAAGDSGPTPAGTSLAINNHLTRAGRYPARPPFKYDALMSVNGLANFDDTTNRLTRLLAINTSQQVFEKATSGEIWGGANAATIGGARLTDFANYRGVGYAMFDDGAGIPSGAASFDGTNVSIAPFTSSFQARTVTTFDERLFLAYPRVTVFNLLGYPFGSPSNALSYDISTWTPTNITLTNDVIGATTTARLSTTSLSANAASMVLNIFSFPTLLSPTNAAMPVIFTFHVKSLNTTGYDTPLSLDISAAGASARLQAYTVGALVVEGAYIYKCSTAGTTAAGAPVFGATISGTTADGSVVWTNIGSSILGTLDNQIIPDDGLWHRYDVAAAIPAQTGSNIISVVPKVKFYSSSSPSVPVLASYAIAYRDGLADGDQRKANFGWMLTRGDYRFPFHNSEAASPTNTATVDLNEIVWTEIGDPKTIRASNTYKLREAVGYPTSAANIGGRYIVAKRNALWQFQGTDDPDIPIRREKLMVGIGVLGPRAQDKYEDEWFFIGENDVYRYGLADDIPKAICGDGMREVVMDKGAGWVESAATYKRPLLAIDQSRLIVWIYTQAGKLFAFDLRSGRWSTHYVSNSAPVDAMIWNPNTGNFYVSFGGFGLTRMDYSAAANDTIDSSNTEYPGDISITFHPVETPSGERVDATFEELRVMYEATGDQTHQPVTASVSFDQGATWAHTVSCTPSVVSTAGNYLPLPIPVWQTAPSVTVRLARAGKLGEQAWALSPRVDAMLNVRRGEWVQALPTAGSVT